MRKPIATLGLVLAASLAPTMAFAQDSAGAEALFQKGHQLFDAKKYAEACPKFAESFRLDPVTGSLLALASCHEAEGKLASAWAEYIDVAARARREGKTERADAAQQRAASLEPKLAKITVALGQGADGIKDLTIKRDGIVVGPGAYGTPLPVDKGEHTVEATAPGHQTFTKHVTLIDGATELVPIPALAESTPAAAPPVTEPAQPGEQAPATGKPFPYKTIGIIAGATGIVLAGVGAYFGTAAIGKNEDSNKNGHCVNDRCDAVGKQLRLDAIDKGNISTALFVVGGLLVAGGIALYIVGPSPKANANGKTAVAVAPAAGPGSAGVALSGRFW